MSFKEIVLPAALTLGPFAAEATAARGLSQPEEDLNRIDTDAMGRRTCTACHGHA
jgi:hypothetical protein